MDVHGQVVDDDVGVKELRDQLALIAVVVVPSIPVFQSAQGTDTHLQLMHYLVSGNSPGVAAQVRT